VVCLYALIHVPVEAHRAALARIASSLRPGGVLMIITGHTATEGVERDWLGVPGRDDVLEPRRLGHLPPPAGRTRL
jgi:hypothetical protein